MPRLSHSNPKYRKHRASGQALVTIGGRDVYLGPHNSAASRREYDRLIAEWLATGRQGRAGADGDLLIVELCSRFWKHAQAYYTPTGHPGELGSFKLCLKQLRGLYADTQIAAFDPLALKAVRGEMVRSGWSRKYINRQIVRIRQVFKWGVAEGIVPAAVWQGLQAVSGLRAGKTDARETEPVKPVPEDRVEATKRHLPPVIRAMVEVQLLTGMRPGEVCAMRTGDLDTTGKLWIYRPERHKTQHHGIERTVYIGPRAQAVLAEYLLPVLSRPIFAPLDADRWHRERRAEARTTPAGEGNRAGSNRKRSPKKSPGEMFATDSYRRALEAAADKAFPLPAELARVKVAGKRGDNDRVWESQKRWRDRLGKAKWARVLAWRDAHRWSPNQLRHNAATRIRKDYGLEAAQVILGHQTLTVTQVYAEKNIEAARRVMGEVG